MNGTSGARSRAMASAAMPSKLGSVWSARIRSIPPSSTAATKPARSATRRRRCAMPPSVRCSATSIASMALSSSRRMLTRGGVAHDGWRPSSAPARPERLERARRRLVEDGPEDAEVLDRLEELLEADRLDDVGVHAELVAPHQIALLARGGQHDDRDVPGRGVALDLGQHLEPVDLRQLEVEQDHRRIARRRDRVGPAREQVVERLGAVAHDHDLVRELALARAPPASARRPSGCPRRAGSASRSATAQASAPGCGRAK